MKKMRALPLSELKITDERAMKDISAYFALKERLLRDGYRFRLGEPGGTWSDATLLNLGFWRVVEQGDVLVAAEIPADVVAHVGWHHATARGLAGGGATAAGLLFGEAIASAFDLYLVGRLLAGTRRSSFLDTQVSAMADVAKEAGLSAKGFRAILTRVAADPEGAFEELRRLLFDTAWGLVGCGGLDEAAEVFAGARAQPFGALLHHYNLANWNLYARAYGKRGSMGEKRVMAVDRELREAASPLSWLVEKWVEPR